MSQPSLFSYFKKLDGNKPTTGEAAGSPKVKNEQIKKEKQLDEVDKENQLAGSKNSKPPIEKAKEKTVQVKAESRMDVDMHEDEDDEV